jgi:branched-chain amino acid transport system substrate-binding protein
MSQTSSAISRKAFLTGVAAGTAALALRPTSLRGQDKPIRIGGQFCRTGPLTPYGLWGHRAAEAAIKKINAEGGIKGRKVEYVVEDTETNVQTGIRKLRKLIEKDEVDFVVGSVHSAINIASAPIAQETRVVYFGYGTAVETTEEKGNRWVFRGMTNMRTHMKALAMGGLGRLGTRWYTMAADYAWGHSFAAETSRFVKEAGGTMVGEKFAPIGTADFVPYISGLNPEAIDVICIGFFARDARTIITQIHQLFGAKVRVTGNVGVIGGLKPEDLGPAAEGMWYVTQYPHRSEFVRPELRSFDKEYRRLVGIDEQGFGQDGSVVTVSFCYAPWEHVHYIKHGIERSGWKSKKDNPGFIQALEGFQAKGSLDFPQGDKLLRAQDHQVFHDQYIERIEKGKIVVKEYIPKEKATYEPKVDYTKEKV